MSCQKTRFGRSLLLPRNNIKPLLRDVWRMNAWASVVSNTRKQPREGELEEEPLSGYIFVSGQSDSLRWKVRDISLYFTECQRIEELELDFNLTSFTSVETVVDMIGQLRTLRKISILRMGLDWEEEKVRGVHEKLIEAVRNHQQLSHLTMKGPLGRALHGRFLVDFMISLFNTIPAPSLKHLDISETGTTKADLFTVMATLRSSPCVRRGPVLEGLRVRNAFKCPDTTITMLAKLRRELKRLVHTVDI